MEYKAPNTGYGENRQQFEHQHREELGVKRYALISARDTLLPIVAIVGGGLAGFHALRTPIKWIAAGPIRTADSLIAVKNKIQKIGIAKAGPQIGAVVSEDLEKALTDNKGDTWGTIRNGWKFLKKKETRDKILGALEISDVPEVSGKWVGAAVGGLGGSVVAGTYLGYENWKKEEMTNVAAREISRDLAELEAFKPSDQELRSEVKRLREMVDKQESTPPTTTINVTGAKQEKYAGPASKELS